MSKLQIIVGSTLSSVRRELLQRGANQHSLVLVPGFSAVRGWRRVAQKYFPDGCALPHFANLDDWFIEAALASAETPLRFITPAQRRLVLRPLLHSLKLQLQEIGKLADSNQFLQQIDRWMGNLFEANVTHWPENGGPWSRDLQLILQHYDSWKQRQNGNVWDVEFAPRLFAETAKNHPLLPQQIIVEAAVTLSPNQRAGLQSLAAQSGSLTATLVAPGFGDHGTEWDELLDFSRESLLQQTLEFWREQNAKLRILPTEKWIYSNRLNDLEDLVESRQYVYDTFITKAHTPRKELHEIATSIRETSDKIHEVAKCTVLLNNSSRYGDGLKSTFAEYGIPLRRSPGQSLLASPLVQKWMQLLNLPNQQWQVNALADVFAGSALAFAVENHTLNVRHIEMAAAHLRQHSLQDLEEVSGLLKSTFIRDLDIDATQKDIEVLAVLQRRLAEISHADSHREWLQLIRQLWQDVTSHWSNEKSDTAEIAKRQISDVQSVLTNLEQATRSWQKYFSKDPQVWQSQLNLVLSEKKSSGEVGIRSGVDAIAPRQLVQIVPEIIYWPGMSEADYPTIVQDALQSRHQKMIRELCPHLPSATAQSIYWMALALAEAKTIYFSRPNFCDDSPVNASVLLEEIDHNEIVVTDEDLLEKKYFSLAKWRQDVATVALSGNVARLQGDVFPYAVWKMFKMRNGIPLNYFDGSFGEGGVELMKAMAQKRGHPLMLSASSLQSYAECGLKYFFQKVLSLEDRPDNLLLLQKQETGSLIHTILQKFYTQFPHPLDAAHQDEAWDLLARLAREEISQLPISSVLQKLEMRRLIGEGEDKPRGMLGKYLLSEVELRQDWDKSDFVQPMQPLGLSSLSLPEGLLRAYEGTFRLEMNGILLEGKFDRLDTNADGSAVMAVDYKTGSVPISLTAPDGVSFQMPLYIWALQRLFGKQQLDVGGIFYSLTDFKYLGGISQQGILKEKLKKNGEKKAPTNHGARSLNAEEWESFMTTLYQQIQTIHYLIEHGQFPISVRDATAAKCEWCDFKNICYRNEMLQMERQLALTGEEPIYTEGLGPRIEWSKKEVKTNEAK